MSPIFQILGGAGLPSDLRKESSAVMTIVIRNPSLSQEQRSSAIIILNVYLLLSVGQVLFCPLWTYDLSDSSLHPHSALSRQDYYYPHFTERDAEIRMMEYSPSLHSWWMVEPGFTQSVEDYLYPLAHAELKLAFLETIEIFSTFLASCLIPFQKPFLEISGGIRRHSRLKGGVCT